MASRNECAPYVRPKMWVNGAKPAELPVMQPTEFKLVINLKTAKSLGMKITESFQQLADEVIE